MDRLRRGLFSFRSGIGPAPNPRMLKIIIEHRRNEIVLAEMNGDWEKKAALEAEVKDLKVRQARLSCALWVSA